MTPPTKPEVTIIGDRLAVFMGADYKAMPLDVADKFVRRPQRDCPASGGRVHPRLCRSPRADAG